MVVAWYEAESDPKGRFATLRAATRRGGSFGSTETVARERRGIWRPTLAMSPRGRAVLAWGRERFPQNAAIAYATLAP